MNIQLRVLSECLILMIVLASYTYKMWLSEEWALKATVNFSIESFE